MLGKATAIALERREAGALRIGVRPENLYLCDTGTGDLQGRVELSKTWEPRCSCIDRNRPC
ncbi:MAG: hypothetical protein R3F37_15600 [Candidatus Competibacteraceae bacterium]